MSTDVNVKVAVRCRPMSSRETQMGSQTIIQVVEGKTIVITNPDANASKNDPEGQTKQFTFDFSYFTDSTQAQVYKDIAEPIIQQAIQGYNGTIFAYGQTGSGKTHTMLGTGNDLGIIPLMNVDLFQRIENISKENNHQTKFLVTVSFLEIYNEVIKDLLNPSDKVLKIREHPDMGIYVEHLAELVVKEPSDVTRLLEQGMKVRQVAATQMNERSSRSHSCFTIKISSKTTIQQQQLQQSEGDGGIICQKETNMTSKINLVDLAGSERASKTGATGERLKEGAAINKSLSALGNVINMLADHKSNVKKQQHVPYRDSKLTRLLQESLGGNALTCMIAAISPADDNYEESLSTLQYANRAKSIKNVTKKNEDINEKIIRELRQEIEKLRQLVESGGNDEVQQQKQQQAIIDDDDQQQQQQQYHHHQEAMQQMEETIANLERIKQESWEEKKRLTELYEQERQKSLTNDQQIFTLMQTVQEEKKHIFKEIKILQLQKNTLFKEMKITKEKYQKEKDKLQQIMLIYQQQENNGEKSIDILQEMDETKSKIIEKRHFMLDLKEQITQIEKLILEEEAAFQAKTFLLQENEQLRKAIQEDEREKMKAEKELYLQQSLEEERRLLKEEFEQDKFTLDQILIQTADKEKKLFEEVEKQRQKALFYCEQVSNYRIKHQTQMLQMKDQMKQMLEAIKQEMDIEKNQWKQKYTKAITLLHTAKEDMIHLTKRNQELEEQLLQVLVWEKPL